MLLLAFQALSAQENHVAQLSFDRVMWDDPVSEVLSFHNPTDQILEIKKISLTPPLRAEDITHLILPGAKGSFRLVLGEDRQPGDFRGTVRVDFKKGVLPSQIFEVQGYVVPPIEFEPYPAFFIATHAGESKTSSLQILNHRDEALVLTSAESHSNRFSTKLVTLEAGKRYRLDLTLDGNADAGRRSEEIILHADPALQRPLVVQANTIIREPVYHFPDSVDLGALPLKIARDNNMVKSLSQVLMVYRPNTSGFEIEASVDLDYVDLRSEPGPDGDRYQLTLTLIPEKVAPGKIDGFVRINTNDLEFRVIEVPVTGYILE